MTDLEWPYNLPIWQRSLHLDSPDGKMWAKIENAVEVSMGNPTVGTMTTSTGLQVEHCNPSFIWSDDSIFIAVPQYFYSRMWGFGKQRLLIIDVNKNTKWLSPKLAHYIQPESFERGEISIVISPFKKPMTTNYNISTIKETFKATPTLPNQASGADGVQIAVFRKDRASLKFIQASAQQRTYQEYVMNESKTFYDESLKSGKIYYEVHENGFVYRTDSDEKISLSWRDIQYVEDRSGYRVDIFLNKQKEISVRYTTNEFSVLLKTICLKLSEIRKESFHSYKFTLTLKYLLHLCFVISVLVLSLIGSLFIGKALFFILLILFVPVGIFIHRQPISLTLYNHSLTVHNLIIKRAINYNEIQNIDFEVKSNDYENTLCILINLKNRKKLTIKKFENIILFFIMLQIKLNEVIDNNC